jgi:putative DNA primase/helicase
MAGLSIIEMKALVEELAAAEIDSTAPELEPDGAITSKLIRRCLYSNERGDGLLFARMYRDKFLFVKRTGTWMVWNGVHWEMDTKQLAPNAVEAVADAYNNERLVVEELAKTEYANGNKDAAELLMAEKKAYIRRIERLRSVRGVANCLEFAHKIGIESLAIVGDEIDCKPWLLACKNGVLDMRTGFLQKGKPTDFLVTAIPTEFPTDCSYYLNTGENSLCPTWDRVILEIHNSDPELSHFIQKWIGYNFTGCVTEHYIGVFVGAGRNGKGTLFETLKAVMGQLAWAIQPDMLLEQKNARSSAGPSADMMSLYGKRLVMASETDEGKRISGSRVKGLTGADSINARSPHDKFEINFTPSHKLNLYTNHIPKGLTKDFALQQRLLFINYPLRYVDDPPAEIKKDPANAHLYRKQDKSLMEQLRKEHSGILAWAVRGALLWQAEGLKPPQSIKDQVTKLHKDEDYFGQFFNQCCETEDPTWWTYRKELYGVFEKWFHEHKDDCAPAKWGCSRQKMGEWIDKNGFVQELKGGQNLVYGIRVSSDITFS